MSGIQNNECVRCRRRRSCIVETAPDSLECARMSHTCCRHVLLQRKMLVHTHTHARAAVRLQHRSSWCECSTLAGRFIARAVASDRWIAWGVAPRRDAHRDETGCDCVVRVHCGLYRLAARAAPSDAAFSFIVLFCIYCTVQYSSTVHLQYKYSTSGNSRVQLRIAREAGRDATSGCNMCRLITSIFQTN